MEAEGDAPEKPEGRAVWLVMRNGFILAVHKTFEAASEDCPQDAEVVTFKSMYR